MKCFNHPDRDACAACADCSKRLCRDCATVLGQRLCLDCVAARNKAAMMYEVKGIVKKLAISSIIACGTLKVGRNVTAPLYQDLLVALFFSGFPWGWSFISELTSTSDTISVVLKYHVIMSLFLNLLKLIASCIIGVFIMIWNIIRIVYLLIKQRSYKAFLQNVREQVYAAPNQNN